MEPPSSAVQTDQPFRKWWVFLTVSLGTLVVALGLSSVNVAIPPIMTSLGASLHKIQWVLTGFMITRTVLIPSVGWLGGRIGDRNLFVLSLVVFTSGSFLCSIAWNADSLIVFRIVQAMGAGPLIAVAMTIMFENFPRHERGLAMGLFMTGWSIGPFFGPLLGGYLAQYIHWRAIFYINVPIGLLSIMTAYLFLPQTKIQEKVQPFDLLGFLTLTGGTVTLLLALSQGQELGWGNQTIVGLFSASVVLFCLFTMVELSVKHPYLELRHFRSLDFSISNFIIFIRVVGFRGTNFLLSLFLQNGLNYTPWQAGVFLLPGAVITGLVSPLAGKVSDWLGPKVPILVGYIILVLMLYGLTSLTLWTSMSTIFIIISIKSFGQSCLNAPLNAVALRTMPEGEVRMGSGIIGMSRGLGEAFGIAVLSFLLERHIFLNVHSMNPTQGTTLSEMGLKAALFDIQELLLRAGEFGVNLEARSHALLGYSLLNQAVTAAYQDLFFLIMLLYIGSTACVVFLSSGRTNL